MSEKMSAEEIEVRFTYHAPKAGQPEKYQRLRDNAKAMAELIVEECPACRETSLAITHLEQAVMQANAAIARRS